MKIFFRNLAMAAVLLGTAAPAFAQRELSGDTDEQISYLRGRIQDGGARWTPGKTSISELPPDELRYRVGLKFQPMDAPPVDMTAITEAPPPALDWRDNNGNYITEIKNQLKCGSCWAFTLTAALESYIMRNRNTPGDPLDLSEQVLVSCSWVGSCDGGYLYPSYIRSTGLPPEKYYPYIAQDGRCGDAAPGWEAEAQTIATWGSVSKTVDALKKALNEFGPLPTAFDVYEDFKHYTSGVYTYTAGKWLGGHAVLLVGYNDADQYFIVKNSWGTDWGEKGFFRIAYSELNGRSGFGKSTIAYYSQAKLRRSAALDKAIDAVNSGGLGRP